MTVRSQTGTPRNRSDETSAPDPPGSPREKPDPCTGKNLSAETPRRDPRVLHSPPEPNLETPPAPRAGGARCVACGAELPSGPGCGSGSGVSPARTVTASGSTGIGAWFVGGARVARPGLPPSVARWSLNARFAVRCRGCVRSARRCSRAAAGWCVRRRAGSADADDWIRRGSW